MSAAHMASEDHEQRVRQQSRVKGRYCSVQSPQGCVHQLVASVITVTLTLHAANRMTAQLSSSIGAGVASTNELAEDDQLWRPSCKGSLGHSWSQAGLQGSLAGLHEYGPLHTLDNDAGADSVA